MKIALYISALATLFGACSSSQSFTRVLEDDIYYVPGQRSLFAQEVKKKTGVDIDLKKSSSSQDDINATPKTYPGEVDNSVNPRSHALGMARYATEKQVQKVETRSGQPVTRVEIPEDDGYWLGGFKGTDYDLEECVRIMNRYPEGFAYFGNGYEIAQNLSFSSDWNVYTVDNRYWWFPSNTNVGLYSELMFGNYPKYIWTEVWNNPHFDSFAWSSRASFNFGFGFGSSYGNNYWNNYWGYDPYWNHGWGYDPWGYRPWGCNSWDYYGYYPNWGHHPGWGNHHPNWDNHRPGWGGANKPTLTTRYAPRKQYTTNRNARSYSTYSRTSRGSSTNRSYDRNDSRSNSSYDSGRSSGSYDRGNSTGSYGRSSESRSSGGGGGPVEKTNTGSRR